MDLEKAENKYLAKTNTEKQLLDDKKQNALILANEWVTAMETTFNPLKMRLEHQGVECRVESSVTFNEGGNYCGHWSPPCYCAKYTFFAKYKDYTETSLQHNDNDANIERALIIQPIQPSYSHYFQL